MFPMNTEQLVGLGASILTALSMVPQLRKLIKTKETNATSPVTMLVVLAGSGLWILYGILKEDLIIIFSNAVSISISTAMAVLRAVYKGREQNG